MAEIKKLPKREEVRKEVIVERSQVDLNGLDVVRVHNNLYEFEFTAYQFYNNSSPIEQVFELHGLDTTMDYSGSYIFRSGELISKPGYIIRDIVLTNPRQMATPYVLDSEGNKKMKIDLYVTYYELFHLQSSVPINSKIFWVLDEFLSIIEEEIDKEVLKND